MHHQIRQRVRGRADRSPDLRFGTLFPALRRSGGELRSLAHAVSARALKPLAIASLLALAACASSATSSSPVTTAAAATAAATTVGAGTTAAATTVGGAFPVTIKSAGGTLEINAKPQAIISLSPSSTEDLFAIGAGDQVKAVDDQSTFPAAATAKSTKLSGFTPNVEAIAGYKPDLVIISADTKEGLVASLGKLGIAVLVEPAANTLEDVYTEIGQLGAATGHVADAAALVATMHSRIDTIVKGVPKRSTPVTYFHEVDNTLYTATSKTFIGSVYTLFGMTNIADPADTAASGGYPQLSQEVLISSNPQLIFLADAQYGESAATVKARPGWDAIAAVKNGDVIETPADIASRWGPRIVDYVKVVADALARVPA